MRTIRSMKVLPLCLLALFLMSGVSMAATSKQAPAGKIDINKASVEQISTLPYVGPKRAAQIVARRQHKPFSSVEELTEIKGIGKRTLEKLRPHVLVRLTKAGR